MGGDMVWRSSHTSANQTFHVVGSWNNWNFSEMEADREFPAVHRCQFTMGQDGHESFKLVVDQNWSMMLYPANNGDHPGLCPLCGPDAKGHNRDGLVEGVP